MCFFSQLHRSTSFTTFHLWILILIISGTVIGNIYTIPEGHFKPMLKNIWDSFALEYGLEIANRTAWLCVSAHLSAVRSKNQEPFGSRNWMRLWSDSGKNKHKQPSACERALSTSTSSSRFCGSWDGFHW